MAYNFINPNRDQIYLMPPSLRDWVPEDDLSWFILDATAQMDLSAFYMKYRYDGTGNSAYDPAMMVSLLFYAYCMGERSSRRIERLCLRDVCFRVITGNLAPDHSTIARFRGNNESELESLFVEVLRLLGEAGLVKAGLVALDGTKMKGNASLSSNRGHEWLDREVKKMLSEAGAKDAEEDKLYGEGKRGDEAPEELRNRSSRLARLKECKERLDLEAVEDAVDRAHTLAVRAAEEVVAGRVKRGRKPNVAKPKREPKANVTDPDSRIMKTRNGYVQGYNAQAVATEDQVIVAAEVTQEANDVKQLSPMLESCVENLSGIGIEDGPGVLVGDAGYWSEENVKEVGDDGPELLLSTKNDWKMRKENRDAPAPRGRIPEGMSLRDRMSRKLRTKRGRELYKKRGWMIEAPFGQIKDVRGCGRFMRRGLFAVESEWKLICATHNLLKLYRSGKANWN